MALAPDREDAELAPPVREKGLAAAGFATLARGGKFVVTGRYGPLRDGELERARPWGEELARLALVPAPR